VERDEGVAGVGRGAGIARGFTLSSGLERARNHSALLMQHEGVLQGLGLGALAAKATKIDESCLLVAASALAQEVRAA